MPKKINHLPLNSEIDHYMLTEVIGGGGFSVVYLARKRDTNEQVVIKEYFPSRLSRRLESGEIAPKKGEKSVKLFNMGRKLFFQEAGILANFNHPNIVNVTGFFSANGTIYTVMAYERGTSLHNLIRKQKGNVEEENLRKIFLPLLSSLREVHQAGLLHLDIKPGNIFITKDYQPLLLDFGAVHKLVRLAEPRMFPVVSHGFSPPEQSYKTAELGPWTDIYAIGATMRTCISGKAPPAAKERRTKPEIMEPAEKEFKKHYNRNFLKAIDQAMALNPALRPQTVDEFAAALTR